ncbi:MAG: YIP1 family protein [Acidobacteriia bacterium]|nr:YIP1 family protein [Terriglobia bacterium]
METIPMPGEETPAAVNHLGRLIGVLFNPKETFAEIARRPSWIAPLALLVILGTGVGVLLNAKMDWHAYIRQEADKNPRFEQLSEEQKENAISKQVGITPYFVYGAGVLNVPILLLVFALIYWGAMNLFHGAGLRYGTAFAVTAHAMTPLAILNILALVVLPMKGRGEVDPQNIVAANVGAFLGADAPKWFSSLGGSLDLFWIWCLALAAVGFSAAVPKKIKPGAAFGTVFGLWAVWVACKVAWAAL